MRVYFASENMFFLFQMFFVDVKSIIFNKKTKEEKKDKKII